MKFKLNKKINWIILSSLLFLFIFSFQKIILPTKITKAKSQGCTYFVATNGNNFNPGTKEKPWRTIQKAADSVHPGDVVCVREGTYIPDENKSGELNRPYGRIIFKKSGTPSAYIIFKSYNGEKVVIDGNNRHLFPDGDKSGGIELEAGYMILDGFEIRNFKYTNGMRFAAGANHIIIKNCDIHHNGYADYHKLRYQALPRTANGALIGESNLLLNDITFSHCRVHHNGFSPGYDHGLYIIAKNVTIERSEFYNNSGNGIKDADFSDQEKNWVIKHNIFYKNGLLGLLLLNHPGPTYIYNNIFYKNGLLGIYAHGGEIDIENNLLFDNCAESDHPWCQYNEMHGGTARNNIFKDPLFIDASNYNFHLKPNSPAIDAGKYLGEAYLGKVPDIGVYEYENNSCLNSLDINKDNVINIKDLAIVLSNWGKINHRDSDLNCDKKINSKDAIIILSAI